MWKIETHHKFLFSFISCYYETDFVYVAYLFGRVDRGLKLKCEQFCFRLEQQATCYRVIYPQLAKFSLNKTKYVAKNELKVFFVKFFTLVIDVLFSPCCF